MKNPLPYLFHRFGREVKEDCEHEMLSNYKNLDTSQIHSNPFDRI